MTIYQVIEYRDGYERVMSEWDHYEGAEWARKRCVAAESERYRKLTFREQKEDGHRLYFTREKRPPKRDKKARAAALRAEKRLV